ncbi:Kelch repeat-containing protein [Pyxidicoccus caerfyrddinensis]|uniref:Kelch repeat-containing protein n=1 Tax=Pyxidicoccus caerfyrddinensis TaxID=2709663 RepID=UPI0013DB3002|nr:kelch motif-containing protein [Pyxidicoccus caerfyrddinensis]
MTRMTKHVWLYLTATLLALVAGCGASSPQEEDTTGSAQLFGTTAQAITSADVTLVRVTVSAADMPARTAELVKTNNQWSGLLGMLPAGTGRTFSAEAFNSSGTKMYAGSATGVTILARQTTAVSITLQDVSPAAPFANAAPVISSLSAAPGTVEPGGTVTLTASASDTNPGDTLTYAWSAPSGTFAQPSSLSTTWTAPSSALTVPLTLTVTDSKGLQGKVTFNVNVTSGNGDAAVNASLNTWPQVSNLSASATALQVNESTTVSATVSDNDGDTLAYSWAASCAGTWTNATSATAQFTATALPGSSTCNNCNLTVTVTDFRNGQAIGGQTTGTLSICVGPKKTAGFPPDITETLQSAASTSANGTVVFRVKAVDPQASAMSFSWASTTGTTGTPTTTADSSEVAWTAPSCTQTGVTPTITATVTNTYGLSSTQSFAVTGLLACDPSGWASAGAMSSARSSFTATQLASGKVLVAGGNNGSGYLSSAELYDPTTHSWSPAGNMATARYQHTATLLSSGKVLIAGGNNPWGLSSAELYDPATNAWSSAGSMAQVHSAHTATLLPSGKVLIAGGDNYQVSTIAAAELYDPATNSWSSAGSMSSAHWGHTATLLSSGKVLIAGGRGSTPIAAAQLYDPATNSWSSAGSMTSARLSHTATLLSSGKVLIAGGYNGSSALSAAELYDPAANSWSSTASMAAARYSYTAAALSSGKVLVSGGNSGSSALSSAELYDPVTNSWSSTASMAAARSGYATVRLSSGQVLVSGGQNSGTLSSAELYSP